MLRATSHRQPRHCHSARARYLSPMRALLIPATLLLAACGFRPLHQAAPELASINGIGGIAIEVSSADDSDDRRVAFLLDQQLDQRLPEAGAEPRYRLKVTPTVSRAGLAVAANDVAARFDYNVFANYELSDAATGEILLAKQVYAVSTYGAPDDAYGRIASELSAADLAAQEAADRIVSDIAVHLATDDESVESGADGG